MGRVVRKINNFKKLYAIAIWYHFGKVSPLPGALYITGNHTIESVRYFIMCLREKEKSLFSKKVQPNMIMQFFKPRYFSSTLEKQLINIVKKCTHLL